MNFLQYKSLLLACIVSALLLVACGDENHSAQNRTVIIGFDGMDFNLTDKMMREGKLPNFSRLSKQGYFGPLATTIPPQSPVAWSSFATGSSPGEHGIYDFLKRNATNYQPEFSIAQTTQSDSHLSLFGMDIPLGGGQIINRRQGQTFWSEFEQQQGKRATVLRVPVTYPPEPIHRMFSGMGIPDLLGTQGTYSFYSTKPTRQSADNAQLIHIRPDRTGRIDTVLSGPLHPLKPSEPAMTIPMVIMPTSDGIQIELAGEVITLKPEQWSEWIPVSYPYFLWSSLSGMVRLHLVESYPDIQLYITPIHIDPRTPVVPITTPHEYANDVAEELGLYHTIGMPEETWSLSSGHLTDRAFLDVIKTALKEREAIFFDALKQKDSELVIGVFVQTDRVSHMFYRGIDPDHPLHDENDELVNGAIEWIYQEADRILGRAMDELNPDDQLMVLSDHGFAPFRRAVNLNQWLIERGYQVLKTNNHSGNSAINNIDWNQTQAYALGLNGLYLNLEGRESSGIVAPGQANDLLTKISQELLSFNDPEDQVSVIKTVYQGKDIYPENANSDAPDLVIGYQRNYRASWQTALGVTGEDLVHDNTNKWSGDHCIAADEVPGIILLSRVLDDIPLSIDEIARYVHSSAHH